MDPNRAYLRNPPPAELEDYVGDQREGIVPPPLEKPIEPGARQISLTPPDRLTLGQMPLRDAIGKRESRRTFSDEPLSFDELSFLLWATQGIRKVHPQRVWAMRTVPSGGCRHPMETYLWARNVDRVPPGLYRYAPLEHALVAARVPGGAALPSLAGICSEQSFVDRAAVTFIWTAIPYRTEWRYVPDSLKDILLSCGHICQNLYLACESIGAGTCAIVAYDQDALDAYVGADGKDEISLYVAPVGKIPG